MAAVQDEPSRWLRVPLGRRILRRPRGRSSAEPPPRTDLAPWTRRCRGPVPCRCLRAAWPRPARVAGPTPRSSTRPPCSSAGTSTRQSCGDAFRPEWRHEERDGAQLLSFFCGEDGSRGAARQGGADAATARPHPADGPGPRAGGVVAGVDGVDVRRLPLDGHAGARQHQSVPLHRARRVGAVPFSRACGCSCGWTAAGSSWGSPPRSRCGRAPAAGSTGTPRATIELTSAARERRARPEPAGAGAGRFARGVARDAARRAGRRRRQCAPAHPLAPGGEGRRRRHAGRKRAARALSAGGVRGRAAR